MTVPAIALTIVTILVPLVQAGYYSLTSWDGSTSSFIGLGNYTALFRSPTFLTVMRTNGWLLLSIPLGMAAAFAAAFSLHQISKAKRLLRTIIFLPVAFSDVAIALFARDIFAPNGFLNHLLSLIGLRSLEQNWLGQSTTALVALIAVFNATSFGLNTVIFVVGLATLDQATLDAAKMDGASTSRTLWHVVLPAMRNFVVVVFVITLGTAFTGLFGIIYVMTGGGPAFTTTTLEFGIYQNAFGNSNFGLGVAEGVLLLIIMTVILLGLAGGRKAMAGTAGRKRRRL